jgi:hypothetical protein
MKIHNIHVSAGRTFNHPFEQYSNFRCDVQLQAGLEPDEDPVAATQALQAQVEKIAEDHKQDLLKNIRKLQEISRANEEISELERRTDIALNRIKELRRSVAAYQGGERLELDGGQHDDESPV